MKDSPLRFNGDIIHQPSQPSEPGLPATSDKKPLDLSTKKGQKTLDPSFHLLYVCFATICYSLVIILTIYNASS